MHKWHIKWKICKKFDVPNIKSECEYMDFLNFKLFSEVVTFCVGWVEVRWIDFYSDPNHLS